MKTFRILCCLIWLAGSLTLPLPAQKNITMRFTHLTIEDGLSQSTINDILQDSRGFLWFATEDGLNRYDGYEFTVYKNNPENKHSLSSNSIHALLEDRSGAIWVATNGGGLNRFNRETETFTRFQHNPEDPTSLSNNFVTALFEDRSGVILVGTQKGLNFYQPEKVNFTRYQQENGNKNSLQGNWITSLYEDFEGKLWIGTHDHGLNKFDRSTGMFTQYNHQPGEKTSLSDNWVVTVYEDRQYNLWVGTQNGGLNKLNRQQKTFKNYGLEPGNAGSLSHNWVLTLFEDRYGEFWVGTMNGLSILDRELDRFINLSELEGAPALNNKSITSLYEDRSGVFWVGTKDDALHKFVRSTEYFTVYDYSPGQPLSLSDNNIWAIQETQDGALWIGTQGGGLNRINPDRNGITYYRHNEQDPNSLSDDFVNTMYEDIQGRLWIGTINGLNEYIPSTGGFKHYSHKPGDPNSLSSNIITTIYEDSEGELWFGTLNSGLSRFDKKTGTFTNYQSDDDNPESLSHNKIWSFYEDRNGVFWVGTHGFGLNKYDRPNDVFKRYIHNPADTTSLSDNFINFIYQDKANRFWIGTIKGLNRFFPKTEQFKRYTTDDGLPNDVIYGIIEDERGHLWLSTNKGLSDFDPERETFKNYNTSDGLPSNEFRFGAYHKGKSGMIYFGGIKGVVAFKADDIKDNPYLPPVVVTNFEIYNKPVEIGEKSILHKAISEVSEINLTFHEQVFSFEFSALHYAAPDQNQYAYKMENFDEDWQYIGDRRFTSFTSLPYGDYVFRVKAANKDGIWNEEGASIAISIAPPPWQTIWAYSLYAVLGIGVIVGFVQFRIRKEKRKKLLLEQQNQRLEEVVFTRTKELQNEKDKSDRLLHNILPKEVADELKELGSTSPRRFEDATILFTDFKDFTSTAATLPATKLVKELNEIFQHFDHIIDKHDLEKIKTIGDAYMAAGGIPKESESHALQTVQAAFEMLQYIEERNKKSSIKWEMRVGIHSGSVIAGVVGRKKFTYDLWGDTVILASRMESAGEAGKANISAATHELVKEYFNCEYRGKIRVEGKGDIDMYFVCQKNYKNGYMKDSLSGHRLN